MTIVLTGCSTNVDKAKVKDYETVPSASTTDHEQQRL